MKKIMMLLMIAVLMLGVSGQAMAYFEDGDLVRVVYDKGGTYEVVTDLGANLNPTSPTTANTVLSANNFSLSMFGTGASFETLYVAYFTMDAAITHAWTSGPVNGTQSNVRGTFTSAYLQGYHGITGQNGASGLAQNINLNSDATSFSKKFGTSGNFGGFLSTANGEANLASLVGGGYVDQQLYYYATPGSSTAAGRTSIAVETIRTFADGHTEINPAATTTPIPAAIYLLGSGLLGLVGIRRKMAA